MRAKAAAAAAQTMTRNFLEDRPITIRIASMATEPTRLQNLPLVWRRDRETTAVDPFAEQRAREAYLAYEDELPAEDEDCAPRAFMRF
jgi:hypothetical protein